MELKNEIEEILYDAEKEFRDRIKEFKECEPEYNELSFDGKSRIKGIIGEAFIAGALAINGIKPEKADKKEEYKGKKEQPIDYHPRIENVDNLIEVKNFGPKEKYPAKWDDIIFERFRREDPEHEKVWIIFLNSDLKCQEINSTTLEQKFVNENIYRYPMPYITPKEELPLLYKFWESLKEAIEVHKYFCQYHGTKLTGFQRTVDRWGLKGEDILDKIPRRDEGEGVSLAVLGKTEAGKSYTISKLLGEFGDREKIVLKPWGVLEGDSKERYEKSGAQIFGKKALKDEALNNTIPEMENPIIVFEDLPKTSGGINSIIYNCLKEKRHRKVDYILIGHSYERIKPYIDYINALVIFQSEDFQNADLGEASFRGEKFTKKFKEECKNLPEEMYVAGNKDKDRHTEPLCGEEVDVLKKIIQGVDTGDDYEPLEDVSTEEKRSRGAKKSWKKRKIDEDFQKGKIKEGLRKQLKEKIPFEPHKKNKEIWRWSREEYPELFPEEYNSTIRSTISAARNEFKKEKNIFEIGERIIKISEEAISYLDKISEDKKQESEETE